MQTAHEPHLQVDEYDGEPDTTACADCARDGLSEGDRVEVDCQVVCRSCGWGQITSLAEAVFNPRLPRATRVDLARRLNAEMPTFKGLLHELEREIGGLLK